MLSSIFYPLTVIIFKIPIIIYNYKIGYNIIINDDEKLQDPTLLLKLPMGTRKNFTENYQKIGTHSQECSPALCLDSLILCNLFRHKGKEKIVLKVLNFFNIFTWFYTKCFSSGE
jgi:hypothetical protein